MTNNKLGIALLILFISLSGVSYGIAGLWCAADRFGCISSPLWDIFIAMNFAPPETPAASIGMLILTAVLDGLVLFIYKKFGKEKQVSRPEGEKKEI